MTFWRESTTAPLARVDVTIMGSISGVSPTATDSANRKASGQSPLVKPLSSSTMGTMTSAKRINSHETLFTPSWNDVCTRSAAMVRCASVPKYVSLPVEITTAVATPETMFVPMNSRLLCSRMPSDECWRSANFSTGSDSPVMAACATNKSLALITRQSAGTMSPAESTMWSPGTSSRMGTSICCAAVPSCATRSTAAVLLTMAFRRSALRCERPSCTKRITVDSSTMQPITTVASMSSVAAETSASTVSRMLKGLL